MPSNSTTSTHIVVVRPGALGDTLLTLPALALLRRGWPAAHLEFVGRRDTLPLVAASGLADETLPYDVPDWSALFRDDAPRSGLAAEILHGADVAVAWLGDPDGAVDRALRALGARRVLVAPARPSPESGEHAALYLARTLAPLGVTPPTTLDALRRLMPRDALLRTQHTGHGADSQTSGASGMEPAAGRPVVAVHPGSGGAAKRWPPERFAAIVARLTREGYRPLLIQGPQDEPVVRQTLEAVEAIGVPEAAKPEVARDRTVLDLAALLGGCAGYLGNDSGVSHLAGLLGVPTLALFGPTDPAVWAPLGPRARMLRSAAHTMDGLDVEAVWAPLASLLAGHG